MKSVGKLDNQDPNILAHRNHHLAHGLRLSRITELDLVELCYSVD